MGQLDTISTSCQALSHAKWDILVISNRWPSAAWSTLFVALMYLYGRILFQRRRVGLMAAGLTAALWWPTIFGRLGLREISQPVMMTPALIGLVMVLWAMIFVSAIMPQR